MITGTFTTTTTTTTTTIDFKPEECVLGNNANSASSSLSLITKRLDPLDYDKSLSAHHQVRGWKKLVSFVGPGFLVSMAYLDPGNLETDLQAEANHRYGLLWVILIGLIFALIIQSLAANLGVCTGKHLSELCRAEYPVMIKYCLWMIAEIAVVAADIPEVIGTAFALNILFHVPIWSGVLFTGFSTLILLGLQRYGVRKLEMLIATLILVMAACFFGEMSYVRPPAKELIKGMFVPNFRGQGATADAIALLGALIMPHSLFLHSALVLSRKVPKTIHGINEACKFFLLESGFALLVAFMINVAVVTVAGAACSRNLTAKVEEQCSDLTLNSASFLLKNVLGQKSASIIYAVAVLASGQSSAISCTYSGQYIMQGFLGLKIERWMRNLITRPLAITPSLLVSITGGSAGASRLIIIASMILSFELPFALIPLLKFSSSSTKMGPHKNSIYVITVSWGLGLGIIGMNVYYLFTGFMGWLSHSSSPRAGTVLVGILVFPLMAVYVVAVAYLMFRKDRVVTFDKQPAKVGPTIAKDHLEEGGSHPNNEVLSLDHLPHREDLADVPPPE